MPWVYDPRSGGKKIPESVKTIVIQRLNAHAEKNYSGKYKRLDIRFRNQFCYLDVFTEPYIPEKIPAFFEGTREEYIEKVSSIPTHLGRIRYLGNIESWSLAFYKYSDEKYEPCIFDTGSMEGTPEEAFDTCSVYLD